MKSQEAIDSLIGCTRDDHTASSQSSELLIDWSDHTDLDQLQRSYDTEIRV